MDNKSINQSRFPLFAGCPLYLIIPMALIYWSENLTLKTLGYIYLTFCTGLIVFIVPMPPRICPCRLRMIHTIDT